MPELFLELFSEEIPARMQARAAEDLARLVTEALAPLAPAEVSACSGPRHLALTASVQAGVAASRERERGPRLSAPEQALAGFLRKHRADRDDLRQEGEFWVLERAVPGLDAGELIAREMPGLLRRFPWPKSMRWGSSRFVWVRPLRRILCILEGEVVHFGLRDGEDDGHGLASSNVTEGHRFLSPGAFAVGSASQWRRELAKRHVIVDAADRRERIWGGLAAKAAELNLSVVEDPGLLDEVAGLLEWPVPLLGRIDPEFMDLPPEVLKVSMRVNQRYFAVRDDSGHAAPWFAFAANIEADDGGAAIIAGNERVLRARFSDARHFWDLDRARTLASRVEDLRKVTFHAKLGSQYERAKRLERIAGEVAKLVDASVPQSRCAGLLCKADLTTGMVGEFPELQGIMGGYYARHDGEDAAVAQAVRDHYSPRGPDDAVPDEPVAVAVALADKLDQLVQFFGVGEMPTGSGDPFALRRAALGIIRLARVRNISAGLKLLLAAACGAETSELTEFLKDRLAVQLRAEGRRHDVVRAAFTGPEDRIDHLLRRVDALAGLVGNPDGANLLAGYRRAANILRIENAKDGPHDGEVDPDLFVDAAERDLHDALHHHGNYAAGYSDVGEYDEAMRELAQLRPPVDAFFEKVTVNNPSPHLRRNRLHSLSAVVSSMNRVADFSKIEG